VQTYSRSTQRLTARATRSTSYVVSMSSAARILLPQMYISGGAWEEFRQRSKLD